ncbi:hypothetical protein M5K25_021244 [Dendrobium thyrsiflorum]|uniref:Uncharacterized protein n=1 Tax=Dendrobium thyrsiflorum TaxID=117978 RepID=A0ABD0UBW7_DENTH
MFSVETNCLSGVFHPPQSRHCRSPFVFFDTEFPGCIFRTSKHHTKLSTAERYSVLKLNADVIRPIQVGLTVSDGGTSTATGQLEIRDFDLRCHPHAPSSIALLKSSGINLTRNRQLGAFCLCKATWVAFHGCYDLPILFKALFELTMKMLSTDERGGDIDATKGSGRVSCEYVRRN